MTMLFQIHQQLAHIVLSKTSQTTSVFYFFDLGTNNMHCSSGFPEPVGICSITRE